MPRYSTEHIQTHTDDIGGMKDVARRVSIFQEFENFDPQKGIFEGNIGWGFVQQQPLGKNRVKRRKKETIFAITDHIKVSSVNIFTFLEKRA